MAIEKCNECAKEKIKNMTTLLERYFLFKNNNIDFDDKITKDL